MILSILYTIYHLWHPLCWKSPNVTDPVWLQFCGYVRLVRIVTIITPSPYFDLAGWWAAGLVTDEEFVASLKYLDFSGILRN